MNVLDKLVFKMKCMYAGYLPFADYDSITELDQMIFHSQTLADFTIVRKTDRDW